MTWLRPEMPAEYCRGIMHRPVHFLSLANGLPLPAYTEVLSYKEKISEEVHHFPVSAIATVEDLHNRHVNSGT